MISHEMQGLRAILGASSQILIPVCEIDWLLIDLPIFFHLAGHSN